MVGLSELQIPDVLIRGLDRFEQLLSLTGRHAGILPWLDDEYRLLQLRGMLGRGERQQEIAHRWIALIAVFGAPVVLPRGIGVLQERHEIRDAGPFNDTPDAIVVS